MFQSRLVSKKEDYQGNSKKKTAERENPIRPEVKAEQPTYDVGKYAPSSYSTPSTMYKQFAPSQSYMDAMNYTNSLLEKLNTGRTSVSDKLDSIMEQISNKNPFSYDFNQDPLFQAQLQSSMASGQKAMQNTMGQAASLTGGYGSSYAQAVGNQAYNEYVQGAYDNLPEYYGMALDTYNSELQNMYNQAELYASRDQSEYDRLANAYSTNYAQAQNQYNNEYSNYWQTNQMNEEARQYNENLAYNNYWQTQKMNEDIRQFNANLAENQYQYDYSMAENQRQYNADLQEKQRQYDTKLFEEQRQYDAGVAAKADELTAPSTLQKDTAKALYTQGGDGVNSKYRQYINSLPETVDIDALDQWVTSQVPTSYYLDKRNGFGVKDNEFVDQWNNAMTYDEMLQAGYTKDEIKKLKKK